MGEEKSEWKRGKVWSKERRTGRERDGTLGRRQHKMKEGDEIKKGGGGGGGGGGAREGTKREMRDDRG